MKRSALAAVDAQFQTQVVPALLSMICTTHNWNVEYKYSSSKIERLARKRAPASFAHTTDAFSGAACPKSQGTNVPWRE